MLAPADDEAQDPFLQLGKDRPEGAGRLGSRVGNVCSRPLSLSLVE
jgi:hypothetical protein